MSLFGRMTSGVLSVLGEDARLRGTVPCRVNIEHGVQLTGIDGESAAYRGDLVVDRDVATIEVGHSPKAGDTVEFLPGSSRHAGQSYRLEAMIEDNGYTRRYTVIRTA